MGLGFPRLVRGFLLLVLHLDQQIIDCSIQETEIQAPGTMFSNFSDEVCLEGGQNKCCRFGILTGVHQGAHICPANI